MEGKASVALSIACEPVGSKLARNAGPIRGTTSVGGLNVVADADACAAKAARSAVKVMGRIVDGNRRFLCVQLAGFECRVDQEENLWVDGLEGCIPSARLPSSFMYANILTQSCISSHEMGNGQNVNNSLAPPCWRSFPKRER